jgi:hypothetical protein
MPKCRSFLYRSLRAAQLGSRTPESLRHDAVLRRLRGLRFDGAADIAQVMCGGGGRLFFLLC